MIKADAYTTAARAFPDRLKLVGFERACAEPETRVRGVFDFIRLDCRPESLECSSRYGVHGSSISQNYLYTYRAILNSRELGLTQERTLPTARWFNLEWPKG
jgi:hypothetical protein